MRRVMPALVILSALTDDDGGVADVMSSILGQVVRDESGIEGAFDVQASWRPDAVDAPVDPKDERPAFFTAIREQLGLRLEPVRAPVEVLAIDSLERLTPD